MFELEPSEATREDQLLGWRMALASLQAERERLIKKYDKRIATLQEAIKSLEPEKPKPKKKARAKPTSKKKRARKAKSAGAKPSPKSKRKGKSKPSA